MEGVTEPHPTSPKAASISEYSPPLPLGSGFPRGREIEKRKGWGVSLKTHGSPGPSESDSTELLGGEGHRERGGGGGGDRWFLAPWAATQLQPRVLCGRQAQGGQILLLIFFFFRRS